MSAPETIAKSIAPPKSRRFFYVRVGVLLTILAGVLLWAWRDVRQRRARNEWDHTLVIAIALVRLERVDDAAIAALRAQLPALEDRLSAEMTRYRPGAPHPFRFVLIAPVDGASPPPAPSSDGPVDLVKYSLALSGYVRDVDARAGIDADLYDVRIEGAHLPLVVVAHELMHTLGATDKYDAAGRTAIPLGLAEPERVPLYPQRFAEIMARNRPVSATEERVPDGFQQIAVGQETAREIGWSR